jgi:hypothetical protein
MSIRRFNVLCGCVLVPIMAAGQTVARACDPMAARIVARALGKELDLLHSCTLSPNGSRLGVLNESCEQRQYGPHL